MACPPSMLLQWQDELEDRFGLVFQILDKDYIARVRRERGYGVNPWTTHTRFLVSHRLLIDEAYTATLRDWLGDFRPARCSSSTKPTTPPRPAAQSTPSIRRSPAPFATWPDGSSIGFFFRPRRTTAIRTASPPCSKSSIHSASAAASRSGPRSSSTP